MAVHTALGFVYIELHGEWTRSLGNVAFYKAQAKGEVIVVAEGATGVKETYWYEIKEGEEVWISFGENVAYLPEWCVRRAAGDHTHCSQKS